MHLNHVLVRIHVLLVDHYQGQPVIQQVVIMLEQHARILVTAAVPCQDPHAHLLRVPLWRIHVPLAAPYLALPVYVHRVL